MKFKNFIFDLDGVLIDSEPAHALAKREVSAKFNIEIDEALLKAYNGRSDESFWLRWLELHPEIKVPALDLSARKAQAFLSKAAAIRPIPGAQRFIENVHAQGATICLVTSSPRLVLPSIFEGLPFHKLFKFVVCADDVKHHKPDPEPYLKAFATLGGAKSECVVIEDSVNGVLSAKAAGLYAAGILTTTERPRLEAAGADLIAADYAELTRVLLN